MLDNRLLITGAAFVAIGLNGDISALVGASFPAVWLYISIDSGQAMQFARTVAALHHYILQEEIRHPYKASAGVLRQNDDWARPGRAGP